MEPISGTSLSKLTGIEMSELAELIKPMWLNLNLVLSKLLNFKLRVTAIKYDSPSHKDGFAADYAYHDSFTDMKYPIANNRNPVWFLQPLLLNRLTLLQFVKFEDAFLELKDSKVLIMKIGLFVEDNHFHCHIIDAIIVPKPVNNVSLLMDFGNIKYLPYRKTARGHKAYERILDKLSNEPFSK